MICGIGIDLCKVERMKKSLESTAFQKRVFGPEEWAALERLSPLHRAESAAADFAAKEAFLKAAGVGLGGFSLAEIQCLRLESGAPVLVLSGTAQAMAESRHLTVHVSLTHEDGMAQALVILENSSVR